MTDYKKQLDKLRDLVARNKGKRDTLLERLKTEYGCETVEEGEKKLKELEAQVKVKEAEYAKADKEFHELYGDKLDNLLG